MAKFGDEAARLVAQRRQLEIQLVHHLMQIEEQRDFIAKHGWVPTQGFSQPYTHLPPMTNAFWTNYNDLIIRHAKLEGTAIGKGTEAFEQYIKYAGRPASPMEWKSFTFGADTSDLTRWQKGKLTKLFNKVITGKEPLPKLVDYFEELDMAFDYQEFRRSYHGD